MKISTQLATLATVVACAFSAPGYAQTTYECETGFSDEKFNIIVPSNDDVFYNISFFSLNTFYKYTDDYSVIRSDYDSELDFQLALLQAILADNLMSVEDDDRDDSDDYFCGSYSYPSSFGEYIYDSNYEDDEIIDAEVTIRNGNPTMQYVYVDNDFKECEAVRVIITAGGVYTLTALFPKDAGTDYNAVFDSFRIVE